MVQVCHQQRQSRNKKHGSVFVSRGGCPHTQLDVEVTILDRLLAVSAHKINFKIWVIYDTCFNPAPLGVPHLHLSICQHEEDQHYWCWCTPSPPILPAGWCWYWYYQHCSVLCLVLVFSPTGAIRNRPTNNNAVFWIAQTMVSLSLPQSLSSSRLLLLAAGQWQ